MTKPFIEVPVATLDRILADIQCQEPLTREMLKITLLRLQLFDRKQTDYGPRNISGFGLLGVLVRMNDKMERLKTLFGSGKRKKPKNEAIKDTLLDLGNYADIATLLERGVWPK